MSDQGVDPSIEAANHWFEKSGLSLDELGLKMGYPKESARKSAWQFLEKTSDPRISMLRKCANALGIKVSTLLRE